MFIKIKWMTSKINVLYEDNREPEMIPDLF